MPRSHHQPLPQSALRYQAEERLRRGPPEALVAGMPPDQLQSTLHELHVHQVELEMQNEQLRATQFELEQARERYIELYDFAPVGYLTLAETGVVRAANMTAVNMLDVERSRLTSSHFAQCVYKDDQDAFYLCMRKTLSSALPQSCELRLQTQGKRLMVARLDMIQAIEDGAPVCRLTISDITGHKRAEEALREQQKRQLQYENEERLRVAFEAGNLGAWDQDLRNGRIVCSDRARTMLGFQPVELVTWEMLTRRVHPEDRSRFLSAIEHSETPSGPGRTEIEFRILFPGAQTSSSAATSGARTSPSAATSPNTKPSEVSTAPSADSSLPSPSPLSALDDGHTPQSEVRWLRFAVRCFFEPGPGRAIRRTGVLADITPQKQAEQLLHSRARELETVVQDRTARLREAVSELEHFSYTLAHDLRAPVRAIRGYGDLLLAQSGNLIPRHKEFLTRACKAAERMDQLILDTLDYTKIVRQHFELKPVDLEVLVEQLLQSYPQFQEARDSISVVPPLPAVMGNPALITQCFSNLLNNALKFVAPGKKPEVRVYAERKAGPPAPDATHPGTAEGSRNARPARVRLWVEDNGIGVPPDCRDKVFEMFQQLVPVQYPGTGIGLAIVKKAVERMRGTVGVESRPNVGSRFWIELEEAEAGNSKRQTPNSK